MIIAILQLRDTPRIISTFETVLVAVGDRATATGVLVGVVLTVTLAVAHPRLGDAAARVVATELPGHANGALTVFGFVGIVVTVRIAVALPNQGDAGAVLAGELLG